MYNLSEKQFKPSVIFISTIFFPLFFGLIAILFLDFDIIVLTVLLILFLAYVFLIFFYRKISSNKNHYLIMHDKKMEINYPNINKTKRILDISYEDVIKLEYYKISSIISWFQLLNGVVPKCVFITYKKDGKEVCELMGHMELSDIKKMATDKKIKLIIR